MEDLGRGVKGCQVEEFREGGRGREEMAQVWLMVGLWKGGGRAW